MTNARMREEKRYLFIHQQHCSIVVAKSYGLRFMLSDFLKFGFSCITKFSENLERFLGKRDSG